MLLKAEFKIAKDHEEMLKDAGDLNEYLERAFNHEFAEKLKLKIVRSEEHNSFFPEVKFQASGYVFDVDTFVKILENLKSLHLNRNYLPENLQDKLKEAVLLFTGKKTLE